MTTAELLLEDYDTVIANTRRTLQRIPDDRQDWVPHDKSMPLGRLAMHCATLPLFGAFIVEDDGMDLLTSTRPQPSLVFTTQEDCVKQFAANAATCRAAIAAASDTALAQPWRFTFGDQLISEASRSLSLRNMCFNHLIHHTAQLGVYLRLNDIAVPALYGPSKDEQWTPPS